MTEHDEEIHLNLIEASLTFQPDGRGAGPEWCVEVGYADSGAELQGWGLDPLAAALECVREVYYRLLTERAVDEVQVMLTEQQAGSLLPRCDHRYIEGGDKPVQRCVLPLGHGAFKSSGSFDISNLSNHQWGPL